MKILTNIGVRLYFTGLRVMAPFHSKAAKMCRAQKGLYERFRQVFPTQRSVIWFHVSSLGEFEQARPVIESWKNARPDDFILLTFFSPSGYEIQKDYAVADYVDYLPFDSSRKIRQLIALIRPDRFILVKYDLWPRLMAALFEARVKVYMISAVFRENQVYFRWFGSHLSSLLRQMDVIFVQDEASEYVLRSHGICQVRVAGDTRIDRVQAIREQAAPVAGIDDFAQGAKLIIGGSTWEEEERMLQRFFSDQSAVFVEQHIKLIIAPHDIGEAHLRKTEALFQGELVRYSEFLLNRDQHTEKRVLLIDRMGYLSRIYGYGQMAFVGGGFGKGIHNVLEPAAFGLPVIFGPNIKGFPEAKILMEKDAGFSIRNYSDFAQVLDQFLVNKDMFSKAGEGCRAFIDASTGSTSLIISCLLENT